MLSCLTCSHISRAWSPTCNFASRASCPTFSTAVRALLPHVLLDYVLSCFTYLIPYMLYCEPLLMECYYNGFFINDISLFNPLDCVNLTALINQPAFIRKTVLWLACLMQLRYFYFNNSNILYLLKNKE